MELHSDLTLILTSSITFVFGSFPSLFGIISQYLEYSRKKHVVGRPRQYTQSLSTYFGFFFLVYYLEFCMQAEAA